MPTRFAPSPTGFLHLGHAYSALTAWKICQQNDKRFIVRIENIDYQRCKPEYEQSILQDLQWLGIKWDEPILKQNTRLSTYAEVIEILINKNLLYPCSCTRRGINQALLAPQNAPPTTNYPGTCRLRLMSEKNKTDNIRLNVRKAMCYIKNLNHTDLLIEVHDFMFEGDNEADANMSADPEFIKLLEQLKDVAIEGTIEDEIRPIFSE